MRPVLLTAAVLGLAACQSSPASAQPTTPAAAAPRSPQRVTGAEARKLVADGALLLDVRTPQEFAEVHLEGARNVPLGGLQGAMATLPRDKPIVVHCAVGSRSAVAAKLLAAAGYDVRDLGGIDAWNQ
jgi:rhodanese-related sulfurtransferase